MNETAQGMLCQQCGTAIAEGQTVCLTRVSLHDGRRDRWRLYVVCYGCFMSSPSQPSDPSLGSVFLNRQNKPARWFRSRPCRGCGRQIVLRRYSRRTTCSERCEVRVRRGRPVLDAPVCSVCGSSIHSRNAKARYCSGACRQRAYRERLVQ